MRDEAAEQGDQGPDGAGRSAPRGAVRADVDPASRVLDVPNEAIPLGAPPQEAVATGSIPAAHRRRVWSRVHALNWRLFLIRFLIAGLAVVVTIAIVPGVSFTSWRWAEFVPVGALFGVLNATIKPLLQFLVLRFILSSYGVVVVAINTLMLVLLGTMMTGTFETTGVVPVLAAGALVGILGLILETLLGANPPVLDRDYKERNALT
jgi:putative membrane protein